jgi:hypothetical protein
MPQEDWLNWSGLHGTRVTASLGVDYKIGVDSRRMWSFYYLENGNYPVPGQTLHYLQGVAGQKMERKKMMKRVIFSQQVSHRGGSICTC